MVQKEKEEIKMKNLWKKGIIAFLGILFLCIWIFPKFVNAATDKETSVDLQIGRKTVTKKTYQMEKGSKKTLKVKSSATVKSVSFSSSDKTIATVSKNGVIRAKAAGTVRITARVQLEDETRKLWMKVRVVEKEPVPATPVPATPMPTEIPEETENKGENKVLVVYFTRTVNTETIADIIEKKTGGTKIRLETVKDYPADYSSVYDVAMEEKNTNARPKLKTKIENMEDYNTIFVGYPIWHGDVPMAIRTFLEEYDFSGKTVVPFCTSASSLPDTSFGHIEESAAEANVLTGFWSGSAGLQNLDQTVPEWLDTLGINTENKESSEGRTMKITVGNTSFTAALEDNSSARALEELLREEPLTINMRDYASMEKVGEIGKSLPRNDKNTVTEAGDIILYQGNSLVIYYDTNTWNFTRIGKIAGVTKEELLKAFGEGSVTVTFSLE